MTRDAEKVVLEYLRRLDRRLEVMAADTRDLKIRITLIEQGLALVNQRVDRVVQRLTQIGLISWKSERSASVWRCDMPILAALGILLLLALVFGPSWWVRRVLAKHGADRPDLPGTGGEFARHLLDELKMSDVKVEITDKGDHYDPEDRAVRLLPQHHDARSVSAVAVAAHEVSHAIQHARGEPAFMRRIELVKQLVWVQRLAMAVLLLLPWTACGANRRHWPCSTLAP